MGAIFAMEIPYKIIAMENQSKKYFINFSLQFLNHHTSEFYGVSVRNCSVQCRLLLAS